MAKRANSIKRATRSRKTTKRLAVKHARIATRKAASTRKKK